MVQEKLLLIVKKVQDGFEKKVWLLMCVWEKLGVISGRGKERLKRSLPWA